MNSHKKDPKNGKASMVLVKKSDLITPECVIKKQSCQTSLIDHSLHLPSIIFNGSLNKE